MRLECYGIHRDRFSNRIPFTFRPEDHTIVARRGVITRDLDLGRFALAGTGVLRTTLVLRRVEWSQRFIGLSRLLAFVRFYCWCWFRDRSRSSSLDVLQFAVHPAVVGLIVGGHHSRLRYSHPARHEVVYVGFGL